MPADWERRAGVQRSQRRGLCCLQQFHSSHRMGATTAENTKQTDILRLFFGKWVALAVPEVKRFLAEGGRDGIAVSEIVFIVSANSR